MDEFYSHYIYKESGEPGDRPVSCAEFITDPDADPVLVIDGMTKCFRCVVASSHVCTVVLDNGNAGADRSGIPDGEWDGYWAHLPLLRP